MATFAFGTVLSVTSGGSLVPVAGLKKIGGVSISADDVDVTTHGSADGYREFIQGLKDAGTIDVEGIFLADTSQQAVKTLLDSGDVVAMEIDFPDDLASWTFNGYINALSTEAPLDDAVAFTAGIKISGKPSLVIGS